MTQKPKLFAHSLPDKPKEEWQELEEHLKKVAEMAASFASSFYSSDWAWNAGYLHDLGKATNAFQSYLLRCNGLDDSEYDADGSLSNHASAGASWAEHQLGHQIGRILAYLSAGHHVGLPDWHSVRTGNAALPCRLEEGRENLEHIRAFTQELAPNLRPLKRPPAFVKTSEDFHLWIRMLYSCLVDADFLDTEAFMNPALTARRGEFPCLGKLAVRFSHCMEELEQKAPRTPVNEIRAQVRKACERAAESACGLFSLAVPTGGGKTLSAMAFALRHALKHGQRRIIYVIPYTSIIEQTAKTLAAIFGRDNVVEHHSNLSPEKETPRSRLAAENWDAPIVVTTNVQFFESLYSAKPGRCRKLHNIVNSVVILDEAQMLPPKWLVPCVDVMNQLARNYHVTLVLATATQPALPKLDPVLEIVPKEMKLYDRLKRTEFLLPENLAVRVGWTDVAHELQQYDQVLCIVNTRRDCHDLFKSMSEGTIHLSALMCGRHRSAVIRLIKRRLKTKQPIRVISTQLVEAGVDIDFPVVYRALSGLDSVAQAAGRCNREGTLNETKRFGQVHVFVPPKSAPRGLLLKGEQTTRGLLALPDLDLHHPQTFNRYFHQFYESVNDTGAGWLKGLLVKDVNPDLFFQFRTAGQEFSLIDDQSQPVFVRYGKSAKWLTQLGLIGPTRENLRALQRYVVNLSKYDVERAKADGLLESIWKEEYWCWAPEYDPVVGVDLFDAGWAPEDLMQ